MKAAPLAAGILGLRLLTGCVTGEAGGGAAAEAGDGIAATDADGEAAAPAAAPAEPTPEPGPTGSDAAPVALGPLEDEDAQRAVHKALQARIARQQDLGNGAEESAELGDFESFRFTVVKVLAGKDDISGDMTQAPDGLEVEVTGWYKKSLAQGGERKSSCFSFDALTPMSRQTGAWVVPADWGLVFAREDEEDCF